MHQSNNSTSHASRYSPLSSGSLPQYGSASQPPSISSVRRRQSSRTPSSTRTGSSTNPASVGPGSEERNNRNHIVITDQQLKNIQEHKYNMEGKSLLEILFLQRFWCALVEYLPRWIAPNLLTVTGLFLNLIGALLIVLFNPDGRHSSNIPWWAFAANSLCLFFYQTLDALDGKQARRTGSASPLGEIFDHGCDAFSTVFVMMPFFVSMNVGNNEWLLLFVSLASMFIFYSVHWQCYCTGKIRFNIFDVTEIQCTIYVCGILAAVFGPQIWDVPMPYFELPWSYVFVFCCFMSLAFVSFITFRVVVLRGGVGKNGSTIAGTSVLTPGFSFALVFLGAFAIAARSREKLLYHNTSLYCATFCLIAAKRANQLIIAHMSRSDMVIFDRTLLGPLALCLVQYMDITLISEKTVLILAFLYTIYDVLEHSTLLCKEIAAFLNINVFTIKPTPPPLASTNRTTGSLNQTNSASSQPQFQSQPQPETQEQTLTAIAAHSSGLPSLDELGAPGRSIQRFVRRMKGLVRKYSARVGKYTRRRLSDDLAMGLAEREEEGEGDDENESESEDSIESGNAAATSRPGSSNGSVQTSLGLQKGRNRPGRAKVTNGFDSGRASTEEMSASATEQDHERLGLALRPGGKKAGQAQNARRSKHTRS